MGCPGLERRPGMPTRRSLRLGCVERSSSLWKLLLCAVLRGCFVAPLGC